MLFSMGDSHITSTFKGIWVGGFGTQNLLTDAYGRREGGSAKVKVLMVVDGTRGGGLESKTFKSRG